MPAPVALGLTVFALLTAFGLGAALLPSSFTGPGTAAERPAAAVGALAPGAGGGVPGANASTSAPPASPSVTVTPKASKSPTKTAKPKPRPTATRTRTATKAAAPQVAPGLAGQENEVIRLTNLERDRAGCGPVRLNTKLRTAMRLHVQELGRRGDLYISHVSADGRSFVDRAKEQGYDAPGGENVARGQRNAADVMNSWMNSDGHRANILNCSFKAIGVGAAKGVDGTIVWGQIFGRA
ncbi:MAG TPA: CAP domain-containing protein [Actinoplanes sp.]|nr:CAP domain-containing protein [Actinoplanes sp.]